MRNWERLMIFIDEPKLIITWLINRVLQYNIQWQPTKICSIRRGGDGEQKHIKGNKEGNMSHLILSPSVWNASGLDPSFINFMFLVKQMDLSLCFPSLLQDCLCQIHNKPRTNISKKVEDKPQKWEETPELDPISYAEDIKGDEQIWGFFLVWPNLFNKQRRIRVGFGNGFCKLMQQTQPETGKSCK